MNETAAYQWWNSHMNEKITNNELSSITDISPPECIMPQKAFFIWSNISPFIQYLNIDPTDIQDYWEFIQKIVSFFCPEDKVPNPISHFPEFIIKLYSIRDILLPKTVSMCLKFIDACISDNFCLQNEKFINKQISNKVHNKINTKSKNKNSNQIIPIRNGCSFFKSLASFCIHSLPLCFVDPVLYFQALITIRSINHPFWQNAVSNTKVVDAFFEMQLNFILPLPTFTTTEFWEHRLCLSDILFHLIEHIFAGNSASSILKGHPKAFQFTMKFVECSIKLAKNARYSISVIFFRYIIRILKIAQNKIPNEQIKALSIQFLLSLDKSNSPLVQLATKFLLKMKPVIVPHIRIIRIISKRGIKDISDIEIISSLCEGNCILQALILLCRSSISNKLLHRACVNEIIGIISRYQERNDVRDWFQIFIRRLFIFISISTNKMKYRTRTLLIVESLASMIAIRILWLQQAILTAASSIWSTKIVPPYFKNFFPITTPPDDSIIQELEIFANSDIVLKSFPFDFDRGTLILLPFADSHKISKSSLTKRTIKRTNSKPNSNTNSNNASFVNTKYGSSIYSITSMPIGFNRRRPNSKNEKLSGKNEISKVTSKGDSKKKRPEPLIKKPRGTKQVRPLASAICVSPLLRR